MPRAGLNAVLLLVGGAIDWDTWCIATDGRYCSVWRGGESCYLVIATGEGLFWEVESSAARHPFAVVEGNLL